MYYKISNVAEVGELEKSFKAKFKHPKIFESQEVINGLEESLVPIIRQSNRRTVDFAIWGILPNGFREAWKTFQSIRNTLNISIDELKETEWLRDSFQLRRCITLATGFFTLRVRDGELYTYHLYTPNNMPMAIASLYTQLDDGFFTSTLLTTRCVPQIQRIQHVCTTMPIVLKFREINTWISPDSSGETLEKVLRKGLIEDFKVEPVSKKFLFNGS